MLIVPPARISSRNMRLSRVGVGNLYVCKIVIRALRLQYTVIEFGLRIVLKVPTFSSFSGLFIGTKDA